MFLTKVIRSEKDHYELLFQLDMVGNNKEY